MKGFLLYFEYLKATKPAEKLDQNKICVIGARSEKIISRKKLREPKAVIQLRCKTFWRQAITSFYSKFHC